MKINRELQKMTVQALTQSMDTRVMTSLMNELIQGYNLNARMGYPPSIAIPNRDAANHIVNDLIAKNLFQHFVKLLIDIHTVGFMGKRYNVTYLKDIIGELHDNGLIYDRNVKMFVEDPTVQVTRNWAALRSGEEYTLSFLRLDIVGNSKLVRKYDNAVIQKTYKELRNIVKEASFERGGRIWNWEGDGGLVAFFFGERNLLATTTAMEIIHELFLYNKLKCKLDNPLEVRLAIHTGSIDYTEDEEELKNSETIKKIIDIEAHYTQPNTVTISNETATTFDTNLFDIMTKVKSNEGTTYYNYDLKWEQ